MNLIGKCLHVVFHRQVSLESFDGIGVLVLGGEEEDGDRNLLGVLGINHGGMSFGCYGEGRSICR